MILLITIFFYGFGSLSGADNNTHVFEKHNGPIAYVSVNGNDADNTECSIDSPCRTLRQGIVVNASNIVILGESFETQRNSNLKDVNISHDGTAVPVKIIPGRTDTNPFYFTATGTVAFTTLAFVVPRTFVLHKALIHSRDALIIVGCSFTDYSNTEGNGVSNYHMIWLVSGTAVINATNFTMLTLDSHMLVKATAACAVDIFELTVLNVSFNNVGRAIDVTNIDENDGSSSSSSTALSSVFSTPSMHSSSSFSSSTSHPRSRVRVRVPLSSASSGWLTLRNTSFTNINANGTSAVVLAVRAFFLPSAAPAFASAAYAAAAAAHTRTIADANADTQAYTLAVQNLTVKTVKYFATETDLENVAEVVAMVVRLTHDTQAAPSNKERVTKFTKFTKKMNEGNGSIVFSDTSFTNIYFSLFQPLSASGVHTHTHTRSNTFTDFARFPWPLAVLCFISTPGFSPWSTATSSTTTATAAAAAVPITVVLKNTTVLHRVDVGAGVRAPVFMPGSAAVRVGGAAVVLALDDDVTLGTDNANDLVEWGYPSYAQNVICRDGAVLQFEKWNGQTYTPQQNQSLGIDDITKKCTIESPYSAVVSPLFVPTLTGVTVFTAPGSSLDADPTTPILAVVFKGTQLIPVNATFEVAEHGPDASTAPLSTWPVSAVPPLSVSQYAVPGSDLEAALLAVNETTYGAVVPPEVAALIALSKNEWRAHVSFGIDSVVIINGGTDEDLGPVPLRTASFIIRTAVGTATPQTPKPKKSFVGTGGFAVLMVVVVVLLVIGAVAAITVVVVRARKKQGYSELTGKEMEYNVKGQGAGINQGSKE